MPQPSALITNNPALGYEPGNLIIDAGEITTILESDSADDFTPLIMFMPDTPALSCYVIIAVAGQPIQMSGGAFNCSPVALQYSVDGGTTWASVANFIIAAGLWSGYGPTYYGAQSTSIIVRDAGNTSNVSPECDFTVTNPPMVVELDTVTLGTVTTLGAGSPATATASIASGTLTLGFGIPMGASGGGGVNIAAYGGVTGGPDCTAALNAAIAAAQTLGQEVVIPGGDWWFASPITIPSGPIAIRGHGKGITRLHFEHTGTAFTITQSLLTNRVSLRDFSAYAENGTAATAAVANITFPSASSFGYVNCVIENVEVFGYPNSNNGTSPFPQTWTRGFVLNNCWSAMVSHCSWFGPPSAAGASSAAFVEINGSNDTRIISPQAYYGHALVIQTGYCEGLYLVNPLVVGCDFVFTQTALTGWTGYVSGKTSLLGLWCIGGELNTAVGHMQANTLIDGFVTGCDITRNTGSSGAAVLFNFTDVSRFHFGACDWTGNPGGVDIAIQFNAVNNSSGCSLLGGRFENMATALQIVGSNGTVGGSFTDFNVGNVPLATAVLDGSLASNGNLIRYRVPATSSQPAGIASTKDHVLSGTDGSCLLRVKSIVGGTDYLTVTPASASGLSTTTLGTGTAGLTVAPAANLYLLPQSGNTVYVSGNGAFIGVSTIGALRALQYANLQDGHVAFVGNYGSNLTPIGGGTFKWCSTSTGTHDGVMTVAPTGITGAGRWLRATDDRLSINVLWCGAQPSDTIDNTAAFSTARTIANQYACPIYVPPGRYNLNWTIADNADLWLTGEGTILWAQAVTPLTVTRQLGTAIPITGVAPVLFGTVSGNSFVDQAVETWVLQGISTATLPSITTGQIYNLGSQDTYPWATSLGQVWQGQLVRVQGICIPFSSGTGAFAEDQWMVGGTSGSAALIRSVSGTTTGYVIIASMSGAFQTGENLTVGGATYGVVSGAAVVAIGERIVDTYATSPQIQLLPVCKTIIDGLTVDVPNGSNVDASVGSANRLPGIILSNCIGPTVTGVVCKTGWTRFLQSLGNWQGDYDVRISYLPDDANTSEAGYGYGVEVQGPDTGTRAKIIATGCRHAFTTNVVWGGYSYMPAQTRGNPRGFLVYGSTARDCYNAGFDTHWGCYEGRFEDCRVDYTNHMNRNVSASIGFQNRGFNTTFQGCEAIGCVVGFSDIYSNLGSPAPPSGQPAYISVTQHFDCQALDYQETGFLVGVPNTGGNNRQEYRNCTAQGDGRLANTPYYQRGWLFDYAAYVRMMGCTSTRFNGAPMEFTGFGGRIEILDCEAYYRDNPGTASGIKLSNFTAADGAYEFYVSNYRIFSDVSTSSPSGVFRNISSIATVIGISGFVGSINTPGTPLEDPTDTGTITFNRSGGRVIATNLTATGTTQGTAYQITAEVSTFGTVASGTGAVLPPQTGGTQFPIGASIGAENVVFNRGSNALLVYPASGQQIESNATNVAVSVAAGGTARFTLESATLWRQG